MRWVYAVGMLIALLSFSPALALQPDEILKDPVMETRARKISAGLRCLVCQNQSIDESDAPLAKDLRVLVRERLKAGDTDAEVRDFVVRRYGEFVLLRPSFGLQTLPLWLAPLFVIGFGAFGLAMTIRRRRPSGPQGLTIEEKTALDKLLQDERPADEQH